MPNIPSVPDNPANDPFTRGFDALHRVLSNWQPFTALIERQVNMRAVNQVPRQESEEDGDWPLVQLGLRSMDADPFEFNSTGSRMIGMYTLEIHSGVLTVELACKVFWEFFRAVLASGPQLDIPDILQKCSLRGASPTGLRQVRGTEQWFAVAHATLTFAMTRSAVMSYPAQAANA